MIGSQHEMKKENFQISSNQKIFICAPKINLSVTRLERYEGE